MFSLSLEMQEWLLGILNIVVRTSLVYGAIILAIRIFGKKELAQLSVVDLVFILLISNSVQNGMVGANNSVSGGLAAALTLFTLNFVLKTTMRKSSKFSEMIQGEPMTLIYEGKILTKNLEIAGLNQAEIEAACREHGVQSVTEVNLAVLEVDGNISVLSENFNKKSKRRRKIPRINKP